jgi:guanine deaminase
MDPDQPVRVCLGTDVGAGNAFSMIRVMEEAYKVGLCNNTTLDGSINPREQDLEESKRNKLSAYRAFYLATLGGAKALYLDDTIGNFEVGKEADFVALDLKAGQHALAWHQELTCAQGMPTTVQQAAELLFGLLACGDDRNVAETWVFGKRVYQCEARA